MLISVAIVGVLSLCAFNSVTAAPVSKFTPDNQGNCAANVNGRQQTYITAAASLIDPFCPGTKLTLQIGAPAELSVFSLPLINQHRICNHCNH